MPYPVSIDSLLQLRRPIGGNCKELYTQIPSLKCDFPQLDQLPITVWSPSSAIKDKHGRLLSDRVVEVENLTIDGTQSHRWDSGSGEQRTDVMRRGWHRARSGHGLLPYLSLLTPPAFQGIVGQRLSPLLNQ